MTSIGWPLRLVRGTVLAVVALLAGTAGHVLAGGAVPDPLLALAPLPVLAAGAALVLRRRVDAVQVGLVLVIGQALLHLVLATAPTAPAHATTHAAAHADPGGHGTALMLGLHLLAAAAGGWWVAAGERALVTLVDLAVVRPARAVLDGALAGLLLLAAAARRTAALPRPARVPVARALRPLLSLTTRRCLPPRAPPRLLAPVS